ncbi:signal peptidase II [Candidatus Oscillochloris fontis]|uniref:signal peptidase II n=1 Tax=Candidatus Oscillochloris fontis TaxID=2496868 RepID=UPI001EE7D919|nr:signal peptidase II [Candidatus Oscillochloris fontis]
MKGSISPPVLPLRWAIPLVLALFVIVCDQLTKMMIVATLGPEPFTRRITLGPSWLNLVYSQNTGVAFGLFRQIPLFFLFTSIVITLAALYAYHAYLPNQVPWVQLAMGLILGGAVGNIIDRVRLGWVVDFMSVGWWPVFNVADSAIVLGVLALTGYLIIVGEPPASPMPPRDDGLLQDLLSHDVD